MPQVSPHGPAQPVRRQNAADWHAAFLILLPSIQRHAKHVFRNLSADDREEAVQAVVAHSAVAFARLVELGTPELAYASVLAKFAVRQYRAGRRVGSRMNCRDVASSACQRRRGFAVESLAAWQLALAEDHRMTPAELAAMRVDFAEWLTTLTPRNRKLANVLATGEPTSAVARMFRVTAGRISQLRRELFDSWQRFMGEAPQGALLSLADVTPASPALAPSTSKASASILAATMRSIASFSRGVESSSGIWTAPSSSRESAPDASAANRGMIRRARAPSRRGSR